MKIELNDTEIDVLRVLLEEASDALSNNYCNDLDLPNTDEHWALHEAAMAESSGETIEEWRKSSGETRPKGKKIYTYDWIMLNYLKDKICG